MIGAIAWIRIKANANPRTEKIVVSGFHQDVSERRLLESEPKTAIFYINSNDGYTLFEDGTKVESVANRVVTFPANLKHTGTSCTDKTCRIVINFNYFKIFFGPRLFKIP